MMKLVAFVVACVGMFLLGWWIGTKHGMSEYKHRMVGKMSYDADDVLAGTGDGRWDSMYLAGYTRAFKLMSNVLEGRE